MDNFIDKIAQKFSSQDVIKANLAAEAKETKRLKDQVDNYESLLTELRQMSIKNMAENKALLEEMTRISDSGKMENDSFLKEMREMNQEHEEIVNKLQQMIDEAPEKAELDTEGLSEEFEKLNEVLHTENVKVYRNVQAAVNESLDGHMKRIMAEQQKLMQAQQKAMEILNKLDVAEMNRPKISVPTIVLLVIILIGVLANVAFSVMDFLNIVIF